MAYTNRELFARLIKCEAEAEGDNGMKAVATVVMNRVHIATGEYQRVGQGNLRRIIFQPGQFDCVRDIVGGQPNSRTIYSCPPEDIHYEIADWALGGSKLSEVGDCLWYFNPFAAGCSGAFPGKAGTFHTKVNQHCFYRPTPYYAET